MSYTASLLITKRLLIHQKILEEKSHDFNISKVLEKSYKRCNVWLLIANNKIIIIMFTKYQVSS